MLRRAKLAIKTISLPVKIARRVDRMARSEATTVSDLFRESFRLYEREYVLPETKKGTHSIEWKRLRRTLASIAKQGKSVSLSRYIVRDRQSH